MPFRLGVLAQYAVPRLSLAEYGHMLTQPNPQLNQSVSFCLSLKRSFLIRPIRRRSESLIRAKRREYRLNRSYARMLVGESGVKELDLISWVSWQGLCKAYDGDHPGL